MGTEESTSFSVNRSCLRAQALQELETVHGLSTGKIIYSPNNHKPRRPAEPTTCPICQRGFCAACCIPGWHVVGARGVSCTCARASLLHNLPQL
jgi:hypothetical protein